MEARALTSEQPRKSSPKASRESAVIASQSEKVVELAKKTLEMIKKKEPDSDLIQANLDSYCEALEALAKLRSMEAWRLEREILPDELKNAPLAAYGLPKTIAPLSLSGTLANPELSEVLKTLEHRSNALLTIANLLDRYVRVDFPLDDISEFYRPAVERLRECSGRLPPESYLAEVVALARELTEKHHNLKIDLHKNICTETGGSLAQSDPDKSSRSKQKQDAGKKTEHGSAHESLASSLKLRWGAPVIDNLPTGKKHSAPKKSELEKQLNPVAPEGNRGWMFAHPELPGMLFTSDQCAEAFSLVVNADFFTIRPNSKVKVPEGQASLIEALRQIKEFRVATHMKDRKSQLKIAMEMLQLELHAAEIIDRNIVTEVTEAWQLAREDFDKAYQWMGDFQKDKDKKPSTMTPTPVRRMIQIWNASRHVAPFEIGLAVALEMRGDRKSLNTERPSFTELAADAMDAARPSLRSQRAPSIPEEWMDPELEGALPKDGSERSELICKHARKLRYLVAMGFINDAEDEYRPAVEKLLLTYSVDALMRHAIDLVDAHFRQFEEPTKPGALAPVGETTAPIGEPAAPDAQKEEEARPAGANAQMASMPAPAPPSTRQRTKTDTQLAWPPVPLAPAADDLTAAPSPQRKAQAKTLVIGTASDEATQPEINPVALMLGRLGSNDKELVMSILGKQGNCTESDLAQFRAMNPGVRDLRFRNMLSAVWTEGDWRGQPEIGEPSETEHLRACMNTIYSTCALAPATLEQMHEAVTNPENLSLGQLALVSRFFAMNAGNITKGHVDAFGIWLSADQQKMKQYWQQNYPEAMNVVRLAQKMATYEASGARKRNFTTEEYEILGIIFNKPTGKIDINDVRNIPAVTAYAKDLQLYHDRWFGPSAAERQHFWRRGSANFISLADLVHRSTFFDSPSYEQDDARIITAVYGVKADPHDVAPNMVLALLAKTEDKGHFKQYYPEVIGVYDNVFGGQNPVYKLLELVRTKEDFNTLSDFLGVQTQRSYCRLTRKDADCRPKLVTTEVVETNTSGAQVVVPKFVHKDTNDDTISQAVVELPGGAVIDLDGVFDGMGGHSTGYIASDIQKKIFEISALSGMIAHPEDVRRAIVMADIAITMEGINRKARGQDGSFSRAKNIQENNMGTTASVSFLCGDDLFMIHCGDSPIELYDENDSLVVATVGHALVNEFLATGWTLSDPSGQSSKPQLVHQLITEYGISMRNFYGKPDINIELYESDSISAVSDGRQTQFKINRAVCEGYGPPELQAALQSVPLQVAVETIKKLATSVQAQKNTQLHASDSVVARVEHGQTHFQILRTMCEGTASPMLHEKLVEILEIPNGNVVTAAVGNSIRRTAINNISKGTYSPIKVTEDMLLSVSSDGVRVPLCSHEIPLTVRRLGGDLQSSASEIIDTAEARTPNGTNSFAPDCGCHARTSKNDDKSVILKRIKLKKK